MSSSSLYLPADDIRIVLPGLCAIEVFQRDSQEQPSYNWNRQSTSRSTDMCIRPETPTAQPNTQLRICDPANMCSKMKRHHIADSIICAVAPGKKLIRSLASFGFVTTTPGLPIETKDFNPSINIYYQHHDMHSTPSMSLALSQLDAYIETKGPFRRRARPLTKYRCTVIYLVKRSQRHPSEPSLFSCGIFFSGGRPLDPWVLVEGEFE